MSTLKELITAVRGYANMPAGDGRTSNSGIARFLNAGKDMIARVMIQQDAKHFEVYDTVDIVADQQEYDIPRHFKDGRITLVEQLNSDGEAIGTLTYRPFQDKSASLSSWTEFWRGGQRYYYLRGRKIGLHAIPDESITAGLRIYGIQMPHDMYWGYIDSTGLTTTAFVMSATSVPNGGSLLAGLCHTEASYYKNAILRIVTSTTARGTERTCTAYSALTRTLTIDPAWTVADVEPADDVKKEFVILNPVAEQYPEVLIGYALRSLSIPMKDQSLYRMGSDLMGEWRSLVAGDVQPRHMDESSHMPIPPDDLAD